MQGKNNPKQDHDPTAVPEFLTIIIRGLTFLCGPSQLHYSYPVCSKHDHVFCSQKYHGVSHLCTSNGFPLAKKSLSYR